MLLAEEYLVLGSVVCLCCLYRLEYPVLSRVFSKEYEERMKQIIIMTEKDKTTKSILKTRDDQYLKTIKEG